MRTDNRATMRRFISKVDDDIQRYRNAISNATTDQERAYFERELASELALRERYAEELRR